MAKRLDLVGQRFGRWTVISYNEEVSKQKKSSHWNCKCDCGNEKVVWGTDLRRGRTNSCGCYNREKVKEQWQDEEFRKMHREKTKEKWQDEEFRQMKSDKMREMVKERWQDEEFRQMQSDKMREVWQDEEFRKMQREKTKEKWQDEEFRQMKSDKMREKWNDEDMKWKMGYKGGITPIKKHLGNLPVVSQWFSDSKQQVNYTCELTGKVGGNLHTHHLKAFSTIVKEAHELHNIQIKPQVKDYTEEELHKLEEYVASWHKNTNNAVVLSEEVHMLFHSLYGKGGNTPEQFEEFRERYMAGEFKDLI